jgi:hypothetical protein
MGASGVLSRCDKAASKLINLIIIDKHHASFTQMVCDLD